MLTSVAVAVTLRHPEGERFESSEPTTEPSTADRPLPARTAAFLVMDTEGANKRWPDV